MAQARRWYARLLLLLYAVVKALCVLVVLADMGAHVGASLRMGAYVGVLLLVLAVEWFLLAPRRGCNVVARVDAREEARREVVLVAHRDSARLIGYEMPAACALWALRWCARQVPSLRRLHDRLSLAFAANRSFRAAAVVGLSWPLLTAVGLISWRVGRAGLVPTPLILLGWLWLNDALVRSWPPFTGETGANDNGTGVAALLAVAEQVARHPPARTTVHLVFSDAEELGLRGFSTWLRRNRRRGLDRYFLAIDCVGEGELAVHLPGGAPPDMVLLGRWLPVTTGSRHPQETDVAAVRREPKGAIVATVPGPGGIYGHWDDGFSPRQWVAWQDNLEATVRAMVGWLGVLDYCQAASPLKQGVPPGGPMEQSSCRCEAPPRTKIPARVILSETKNLLRCGREIPHFVRNDENRSE